jgi:hypothetical protein
MNGRWGARHGVGTRGRSWARRGPWHDVRRPAADVIRRWSGRVAGSSRRFRLRLHGTDRRRGLLEDADRRSRWLDVRPAGCGHGDVRIFRRLGVKDRNGLLVDMDRLGFRNLVNRLSLWWSEWSFVNDRSGLGGGRLNRRRDSFRRHDFRDRRTGFVRNIRTRMREGRWLDGLGLARRGSIAAGNGERRRCDLNRNAGEGQRALGFGHGQGAMREWRTAHSTKTVLAGIVVAATTAEQGAS